MEDRLDRVATEILHHPDPVVTAVEIAEVDEFDDESRRDVLDALYALERTGEVASKQTGASARAWWHTERVVPSPPRDPADHPDQRGLAETTRANNAGVRNDDQETDGDQAGQLAADDLDVALEGWRPGRSRQERRERRRAGLEVLRWLRDRDADGPVTRADVLAATYDDIAIGNQSEDTYWRQIARPAFSHAADANLVSKSNSGRKYRWSKGDKGT